MSENKASLSIPSILAILAAILSFNVGAILGLVFAALALIFGPRDLPRRRDHQGDHVVFLDSIVTR